MKGGAQFHQNAIYEWVGKEFVYSKTDMKKSHYQPDRANANVFSTAKMLDAKVDIDQCISDMTHIHNSLRF